MIVHACATYHLIVLAIWQRTRATERRVRSSDGRHISRIHNAITAASRIRQTASSHSCMPFITERVAAQVCPGLLPGKV
ncbi:hypothetical protein CEXT_554861 [Caerostris extrusa]|uniref:Secreted protein n=1 Tax=Caerostris extrusa TaxID=172846 RepID=A0AAV4U4Z0_CAEEX|nr:hypothetical protein CEXT_554861 [Caerostris extrusa]